MEVGLGLDGFGLVVLCWCAFGCWKLPFSVCTDLGLCVLSAHLSVNPICVVGGLCSSFGMLGC